MVIVEPRAHPLLEPVIKNFHETMPTEWDLYVFHGKSHAEFAANATKGIQGRKVILKALEMDNLTANQYNELFLRKKFWEPVDAEDILIFQTDTALCGKVPIDDFLNYSYIGCAYTNTVIGPNTAWGKNPFYGVGGLSLRKKSFMMKCIDTLLPDPTQPFKVEGKPSDAEDVAFSWCAEHLPGAKKPESAQTIANFCAQNSLHAYPPFGIHKTNHEFKGDKQELFKVCPAAQIIESGAAGMQPLKHV